MAKKSGQIHRSKKRFYCTTILTAYLDSLTIINLQEVLSLGMWDNFLNTVQVNDGGAMHLFEYGTVKVLEQFRKNCEVLVGLGDCAMNGGIPAMRNHVPLRECLEVAYLDAPGIYNPGGITPNDPEIPLLLHRVYPCHEVVKIDYFIPGCPPPADAIWDSLVALLNGEVPKLAYTELKYD